MTLSKEKKWLLSQGAIMAQQANYSHENIYLNSDGTLINKESVSNDLKESWNIGNRKDLFENLKSILEERDLSSYNEVSSNIKVFGEKGKSKYLKENYEKNNLGYLSEAVKHYNNELILGGTSAWDFGRYAFLCRLGCLLEYIDENEMWDKLYYLSKNVRNKYSSWREYFIGYFVGRKVMNNGIDDDNINYYSDISKELLFGEYALWRNIDWNMDLEKRFLLDSFSS